MATFRVPRFSMSSPQQDARLTGNVPSDVNIAGEASQSPSGDAGLPEPILEDIVRNEHERGGERDTLPEPRGHAGQADEAPFLALSPGFFAGFIDSLPGSPVALAEDVGEPASVRSSLAPRVLVESARPVLVASAQAAKQTPAKRKTGSDEDDDDDEDDDSEPEPMPVPINQAKLKMLKKLTPVQFEQRLASTPVILKRFQIARDVNKPKNWHHDRAIISLDEHTAYLSWCMSNPEEAKAFKFFEVKVNSSKHRKIVQGNNQAFKLLQEKAEAFQHSYELFQAVPELCLQDVLEFLTAIMPVLLPDLK